MKSNYVSLPVVKTVVRNLFFTLFLAVVTAAGARAQVVQASYSTPVAPAVSQPVVTYLGSGDEEMSFNLKYENAAGAKFLVTVIDSEGETLFDQVFTDKKFNKTFRVPAELGKLSFVIRDLRTRTQKKIEVSTERRFVEEVSVTKVN
jgi:hypothetical protein